MTPLWGAEVSPVDQPVPHFHPGGLGTDADFESPKNAGLERLINFYRQENMGRVIRYFPALPFNIRGSEHSLEDLRQTLGPFALRQSALDGRVLHKEIHFFQWIHAVSSSGSAGV